MKEYAVNWNEQEWAERWEDTDLADWFTTWADARAAALEKFEDPEITEARITAFVDGEVDDSPYTFLREDGAIHEYQDGERLWL